MKFGDILQKFYEANANLYQRLQEQRQIHQQAENVNVNALYNEIHQQATPCFVLSTGRCGTKLLTTILQKNRTVKGRTCAHARIYPLRGICLPACPKTNLKSSPK
ncbi:MAG: hypothetical protein U5K69_04475 [Balneolaceae bacterium]|nr:hypothetical protein [Balneolaceae bacterium]